MSEFDKSKKYVDRHGDLYHHDGTDWIRWSSFTGGCTRSREEVMRNYRAKPIEEGEVDTAEDHMDDGFDKRLRYRDEDGDEYYHDGDGWIMFWPEANRGRYISGTTLMRHYGAQPIDTQEATMQEQQDAANDAGSEVIHIEASVRRDRLDDFMDIVSEIVHRFQNEDDLYFYGESSKNDFHITFEV